MWRLFNRGVVWLGPGAPALYVGTLSLAAEAAPANRAAQSYLDAQIEMIEYVISDPRALFWVFFVLVAWAVAVWFTDYMDRRVQKRSLTIQALGERAQVCADGIIRLVTLHKHREAVAKRHAWAKREDFDFFVASSSLMGDYAVMYAGEALALLKSAQRRKIPLEDRAVSNAEHPTNPLGVEQVSRDLTILADRIKTDDLD